MIAKIARPLAVLATLGWVLTLLLSLASLAAFVLPLWTRDAFFFALCPLFLGGVIAMNWRIDGRILTHRIILDEAIDGSPAWVRYAVFGTLFFAFGLFGVQFFDVFVPEMSLGMALLS